MEVMYSYNGTKVHLANGINDCTNFQPQKPTASISPLRDQPATCWNGESNLSSLEQTFILDMNLLSLSAMLMPTSQPWNSLLK